MDGPHAGVYVEASTSRWHTVVRSPAITVCGPTQIRHSHDGAPYDGALCYPNDYDHCEYGKFGEGSITPRNSIGGALMIVLPEENFDRFPSTIGLKVWAKEDDAIGGAKIFECLTTGCPVGDAAAEYEWRVPQGVESATHTITLIHNPTAGGQSTVQEQPVHATTHTFTLTGLTSNTRYDVSVWTDTRAGQRT
ncbi:MAG: hypothetical protein ACRDJE_18100 [Dehalococcoidia bacterium]